MSKLVALCGLLLVVSNVTSAQLKTKTLYITIVGDGEPRTITSDRPRGTFTEGEWYCRWTPDATKAGNDYWIACTTEDGKVNVKTLYCGQEDVSTKLGDTYVAYECTK